MSDPVSEGSGGYSHKVSYNESPWPNRFGYRGICRQGAHLFTNEEDARKFMERNLLREPVLHKWVMEKRMRDGRLVLVGRWK